MIWAEIQSQLEAIYGIRCPERVANYVVGKEAAEALGGTCRSGEELLLCEDADALQVAVYFSKELRQKLESHVLDSLDDVLQNQLNDYCQLAEGVSHFLYLAQVAEQERQVSLLELETQAEIDKFASCILHRWESGGAAWAAELHRRLFDDVSYLPELSAAERARYEGANRLARQYCSRLMLHVVQRRRDRLLTALRYSYRLGAEAKMRHLAQAA